MTARTRTTLLVVAVVVATLGVATLADRPATEGAPLDPESSGPLGTKALVDVLDELGAAVEVITEPPSPGTANTALLLADALDDDEREAWRAWAQQGGTLVVADPQSPLTPDPVGDTNLGVVDTSIARGCDLEALRDVARVSAPGGFVYETPEAPNAVACFPRSDGHWLVATTEGEGTLVVVGGRTPFTNRGLAAADNPLLVTGLLAPDPPDSEVLVALPQRPGEGEGELADLLPSWLPAALLQAGLAFVLIAVWRARRLGRPVAEPQPVHIPASELVAATGGLLARADARDHAATQLRATTRRELAERLGLPAAAPADDVADAVATRAPADRDEVARLLDDSAGAPVSDAELVELARALERVRTQVLDQPAGETNE